MTDKTYPNEGARRLAEVSERLNESQRDVAKRLDTNVGTISRWLSGEALPSLSLAGKVQREYGVGCDLWLLPAQTQETK